MSEEAHKLTGKQDRFCREYMANGFNATAAAIAAGYSPKTAYAIGHENLRKPEIRERIDQLNADGVMKLDLSKEAILREVGLIAFGRMGRLLHITEQGDPYLDYSRMTEAERASLSQAEIEDFIDRREVDEEGKPVARDVRKVKGKMNDKVRALDLLLRAMGYMPKEQVEVEFKGDFAAALEASRRRAAASKKVG